jgi:tRNA dimethylallyltransferase
VSFHPVVFVLGPTAVGKSELGLIAAEKFSGAIMNCDSVQCFAGVDIGTAKPTPLERQRVPHFLLDCIPRGQALTAGKFHRLAHEVLRTELPRRPIFAVGGSGFYIQALEKGLFEVKGLDPSRKAQWQDRLRTEGSQTLFKELVELDPEYAQRLSPSDGYRITRALMIIEAEGRTVTSVRKEFAAKKPTWIYPKVKIGLQLPREVLRLRIEHRSKQMLENGLIGEVQGLIEAGLRDWAPLHSVGYREVVLHLQGEIAMQDLSGRIVQSTMALAKKQMTWFRKDPEITWHDPTQDREKILTLIGESLM